MKAMRDVLRYLISLILMFVLILLLFGLFVKMILLNPDYYINELQGTSYYKQLREEIDSGLVDLSLYTSIPVEVLVDAVKDDSIKTLSVNDITLAMQYMKYRVEDVVSIMDSKPIETSLNNFIDDYAAQNDLEVDDELRLQMKEVADQVANIVSNHTVLFNINAVKRFGDFQRFRKIVSLFYDHWYAFLLAALLCMFSLFTLSHRHLHRGFLWSGSSMIAASLMVVIPAALGMLYRVPYRFSIATSYLKTALRVFTLGYFRFFIFGGLLMLIIGFLCLILYMYLGNNARLRHREIKELEEKI